MRQKGIQIDAPNFGEISPVFADFLSDPGMPKTLDQVTRRLCDRLAANTDPLQKAVALCRVFQHLRDELTVKVGEIPKNEELGVQARFLAEYNPDGLFTTFVYLYEFLFVELTQFVSSAEGEHELQGLQNLLETYFLRILPIKFGPIEFDIDLFRLIRTRPKPYKIGFLNAPEPKTPVKINWKSVVREILGLETDPENWNQEFIAVCKRPDASNKFQHARVVIQTFDQPPRELPTDFDQLVIVHQGEITRTNEMHRNLSRLFVNATKRNMTIEKWGGPQNDSGTEKISDLEDLLNKIKKKDLK
jgi:hypothetical protein